MNLRYRHIAFDLDGTLIDSEEAVLRSLQDTLRTVTGNEYYSDKQIVDFILGDGYQRNTLYLFLQYKYQKHPVIPFVDDFEVTIDSIHSIQIRVYEKSIIGYVRYLGRNVYFDKNGTVVESTNEQMEGIPMIRGLYFDQLVPTALHPVLIKVTLLWRFQAHVQFSSASILDRYGSAP